MGTLDGWRVCPRCANAVTPQDGKVECSACGFVQFASAAPAAAAFVLDDRGRLLLARRAHEPNAGLWDTPGGFVEEREHPVHALRRELLEETGLEIDVGDFVGAYVDRYGTAPDAAPVLNLVWEATVLGGEMEPADDVAELRWYRLDTLPADGELAFSWIAPALRGWSRARGA